MEENSIYDIQKELDQWYNEIQEKSSMTESDWLELKIHLLDIMDKLKRSGLDDEEAFLIACKRLDISSDLDEAYQKANNDLIQVRNSLMVLTGVMAYFLSYYFIHFSSNLLGIILISTDIEAKVAVTWISRYIITWYFVAFISLVSIYFMDKLTITLIKKIRLKPGQTITILIIVILLGITDTNLYPLLKNMIRPDVIALDKLIHTYVQLELIFPLLIGVGYILIYLKYYSKTKTPEV